MVCDEGVGRTTVAGRISLGLWTAKGNDTTVLKGGLEGESVLEGLNLTNPRVFARIYSSPAAVINLCRTSVSLWGTELRRGSHLLSDI